MYFAGGLIETQIYMQEIFNKQTRISYRQTEMQYYCRIVKTLRTGTGIQRWLKCYNTVTFIL